MKRPKLVNLSEGLLKGNSYNSLAIAIVSQAITDYTNSLIRLKFNYFSTTYNELVCLRYIDECETFFKSQLFQSLTDLEPDILINYCLRRVKESTLEE